jgi:hypothetical protein
MSIIRTKKYSALEILEIAFPKGVDVLSKREIDHVVTAEDLAVNPGLESDVKVGDTIQIPDTDHFEVADVFGKYTIVIGGITGIVDPERKIIVEGTEPLEITVGNTLTSLEVTEPAE